MSTFDEWKIAYQAFVATSGDDQRPILTARLMNFESEDRLADAKEAFSRAIADEFARKKSSGTPDEEAAFLALGDVIRNFWTSGAFRMALPAPALRGRVFTYVSADDLAQVGGLGDIDTDAPPRKIPVPHGKVFQAARKPIVWVSPDACPDDPFEVAAGLGLPHFVGAVLYRFELPADPLPIFIPSCFDARLYEAWQISSKEEAHVCGRTRHVESGERRYREFITPTPATDGHFGTAVRVPDSSSILRVSVMTPDYLSGRA